MTIIVTDNSFDATMDIKNSLQIEMYSIIIKIGLLEYDEEQVFIGCNQYFLSVFPTDSEER